MIAKRQTAQTIRRKLLRRPQINSPSCSRRLLGVVIVVAAAIVVVVFIVAIVLIDLVAVVVVAVVSVVGVVIFAPAK